MSHRHHRAFTLLELIAVISILAITVAIAVLSFEGFGNRLRSTAGSLSKDIQGTFFQSIRRAQVYRMSFVKDKGQDAYVIESFKLPEPPPPQEDVEAYKKWEDRQREKEEERAKLSTDQVRELTLLDFGEFEVIKEKKLPEGIHLQKILKANSKGEEDAHLIFYPTGEMPYSLIVLQGESGKSFSLEVDSLSGRVRIFKREVTEAEWKNRRFEE